MYAGKVLILAGGQLAGGACGWLPVAAFAVAMGRLFIVPEERLLAATFGDDFRHYKGRVRESEG